MSSVHTKPRLLVVDDDEDIRALLRLILERGGYEVDEQPDGRAALRQVDPAVRVQVFVHHHREIFSFHGSGRCLSTQILLN